MPTDRARLQAHGYQGLLLTAGLLAVIPLAGSASAAEPLTSRVSVDSGGQQATDGDSYDHAVSADGRVVAFRSEASDLVEGDSNGTWDVFVHDRDTGQTSRVSVGPGGEQAGDGDSSAPTLSGDGRFVAFQSNASTLVEGDTNGLLDIFVHDRETGTTSRISVAADGEQAADGDSFFPSISADGRFVAFMSTASNLVEGDTNGLSDVFVHDRQTGQTSRINVTSGGAQATDGDSYDPAISADGRFVAFESGASNLVKRDKNGSFDVFVHDRQTAVTTRVSDKTGSRQAADGESGEPAISADGRFVAFGSSATNLVTGDTNDISDVFVRDRETGEMSRVSVGSAGEQVMDGYDSAAAISAEGRFVAFESGASTLVAGDLNEVGDIFVHDRETGETLLVSVATDGAPADGWSYGPALSADGRLVVYHSDATNLIDGDTNGISDVFVYAPLP